MTFREWLEEDSRPIPDDAIKVNVPDVWQQTSYSCGASALKAVCDYFDVGLDSEEEYRKALDTDHKHGTKVDDIVRVAKEVGLQVQKKENMSLEELFSTLDNRLPVICALQAWGDSDDYKNFKKGHYVVVIGYSEDKVYFEEPALKGTRGFLTHEEFMKRWQDKDPRNGKIYRQLGIVFWKDGKREPKDVENATKMESAVEMK